jgi:hypothetical protein
MKSNGTICGTATTVPHTSRVFRGTFRQRSPNTMKVGIKEAAYMAFGPANVNPDTFDRAARNFGSINAASSPIRP